MLYKLVDLALFRCAVRSKVVILSQSDGVLEEGFSDKRVFDLC